MSTSLVETPSRMPALFVGHGNPMNAIEDNDFSRMWNQMGQSLPHPAAILCISAHWQTNGTHITAMERPRTIHDFYGFPPELYAQQYPAPGSRELVHLVQEILHPVTIAPDTSWGLDHGSWSVLIKMYPTAEIPVVQLSLDAGSPAAYHYRIGKALRPLRRRGVLILGSGNVVHNLRTMCWEDTAYEWAFRFDELVTRNILDGTHQPLIDYPSLGPDALRAIPTDEHYLPLLYVLGLQEEGEQVVFFNERVTACSISMRSLRIG
jgi:4,5-DOPA dioxygenase extradiol